MSVRVDKVASVIKRALADPISEFAREHSAGMVTVTSVRMSKDLLLAKVYISVFNGKIPPASFITLLETYKPKLRSSIAPKVQLRFIPDLKFYLDDTLNQIDHIQGILNKINAENHSETE